MNPLELSEFLVDYNKGIAKIIDIIFEEKNKKIDSLDVKMKDLETKISELINEKRFTIQRNGFVNE